MQWQTNDVLTNFMNIVHQMTSIVPFNMNSLPESKILIHFIFMEFNERKATIESFKHFTSNSITAHPSRIY